MALRGRVYVGAVWFAALVVILLPYSPRSINLQVVLSLTLLSVAVERVNLAVLSRDTVGVAMHMTLPSTSRPPWWPARARPRSSGRSAGS